MPALTPTTQDIKSTEKIAPGRYRAKVVKVEEDKPSNDGNSLNDWVHFEITEPGDYQGRLLRRCFSEKEPNRRNAIKFFSAFGMTVEAGKEYRFKNTEGRELYIYVGHRLNKADGKTYEDVSDFQGLEA